MATQESDIDILNGLIETTIDSADGYAQAAETATEAGSNADLVTMFHRFGSERQTAVAALRAQVVVLGGTPEDDGSLLAGAHRSFLQLKSLFGSSRERIIEEVESGEDQIKHKYEDAMKQDLSPATHSVISKAYETVRQGHDTVRDMKRAPKAA